MNIVRTLQHVFLVSGILLWTYASAQPKDNEECRKLYNAELFNEAYACYSADDNELFSVYMSAYLARFLEKKKEYRFWSKKLRKNFDSPWKYYYCANLHPVNSKKFVKYLNKGLKEYENDTLLLMEKVNYFIEIEEYEKGIPLIEKLIGLKKNDIDLYLTAGDIYKWISKYQKAIPYYEKVLDIDYKNHDANYNLGMIYYGQATDLLQRTSSDKPEDELERMRKEALSLLKKALPYLEYAFEGEPENANLKSALLTCYLHLDMEQEYNTLKNS